jgi:hypothetical protein
MNGTGSMIHTFFEISEKLFFNTKPAVIKIFLNVLELPQ